LSKLRLVIQFRDNFDPDQACNTLVEVRDKMRFTKNQCVPNAIDHDFASTLDIRNAMDNSQPDVED
jgi:hypothetical protein